MPPNSNLTLFSGGPVVDGEYSVHYDAHINSLAIDAGMTVQVPIAPGNDLLLNFGSTDVLQLAAHFADLNDLFAHASENCLGQTVLQLDAGTDTLTLGIDESAFVPFAQEGLVKFH